ncbi:UDP-N-acetylmuramate dehydrogenase [Microcella putealis]|uniref:UDP-N-acetylenolpyruvoylglucosamine reductase n=1 Tax=Microcella putealis TaxID=337005 RepID=A0A4Q7LNH9_9MICO|nr:UDP-N-acetylmuramate dehydrogenase [Microcella putealis]RZS55129.1 UDP-N-acetylmuramate dehydrogenase [Microcella putealis]TQM23609.1 UDP-N-acetylmuramate dehydrogenase [Microcella putealis]
MTSATDDRGATLAALTTLRVGGPAARLVEATSADELVDAVLEAQAHDDEWLVLGGGSNVLVGDQGVDGTVIRVMTRGIERLPDVDGSRRPVRLRVAAGEPWDDLVAHTVDEGFAGLEALSGIPGSTGAAPIQNIGAYGQEIGESLVAVEILDLVSGERRRVPAPELELGYRASVIKAGRPWVVLSVDLALERNDGARSRPVAYAQLADSLGVAIGERAPVAGVRSAVIRLRASKGMVLDENDPDSVSAGSFFTNPIVSGAFARTLPTDAPRFATAPEPRALAVPLGAEPVPPPEPVDAPVKLSAAWLIERAGITRGFSLGASRAAVSKKHTLAITNTGGATAAEIAELARYIQTRVLSEFGVMLHPEPVFVGVEL